MQRQDVDEESALQSALNVLRGAVGRRVRLVPPGLLARSGNDPLVARSVQRAVVVVEHFAEDAARPRRVETGQYDAHVLLDQLLQRLFQIVHQPLRLDQFNVGVVQQRDQRVLRLNNPQHTHNNPKTKERHILLRLIFPGGSQLKLSSYALQNVRKSSGKSVDFKKIPS